MHFFISDQKQCWTTVCMCMKQHYTWTWLQAGGHRDKQSYRNFSYLHISHSAVQLLCCMPLNCCYISLWCSLHKKIRFFLYIVYVKAIFPSAVNDSWRKNETNKGVRTTESVETVLRQCHFFSCFTEHVPWVLECEFIRRQAGGEDWLAMFPGFHIFEMSCCIRGPADGHSWADE